MIQFLFLTHIRSRLTRVVLKQKWGESLCPFLKSLFFNNSLHKLRNNFFLSFLKFEIFTNVDIRIYLESAINNNFVDTKFREIRIEYEWISYVRTSFFIRPSTLLKFQCRFLFFFFLNTTHSNLTSLLFYYKEIFPEMGEITNSKYEKKNY